MVLHYDIDEVRPYINWIYFDHAWSMSGKSEADKAGLYADANEPARRMARQASDACRL